MQQQGVKLFSRLYVLSTTSHMASCFAGNTERCSRLPQVEAELQELEEEEALEYLQSLGVEEGGLRSLIAATYKQLGLLTYFTTGRRISLFPCFAFWYTAVIRFKATHLLVTRQSSESDL